MCRKQRGSLKTLVALATREQIRCAVHPFVLDEQNARIKTSPAYLAGEHLWLMSSVVGCEADFGGARCTTNRAYELGGFVHVFEVVGEQLRAFEMHPANFASALFSATHRPSLLMAELEVSEETMRVGED